jgi:tetratricopeptide (TPR) repeat protein
VALDTDRRAPNVDWIRNRVAMSFYNAKDYENAWAWYGPGVQRGTIDDGNLWDGAMSALQTKRYAEAVAAFRRAAAVVPDLAKAATQAADQLEAALAEYERERKQAKQRPRTSGRPAPPGVLPATPAPGGPGGSP